MDSSLFWVLTCREQWHSFNRELSVYFQISISDLIHSISWSVSKGGQQIPFRQGIKYARHMATDLASGALPHSLQKRIKCSGKQEGAGDVLGGPQVLEVDQTSLCTRGDQNFGEDLRISQASGWNSGSWAHTTPRVRALARRSSQRCRRLGWGAGREHITLMATFSSYFHPRPACQFSLIYFRRSPITSESSINYYFLLI